MFSINDVLVWRNHQRQLVNRFGVKLGGRKLPIYRAGISLWSDYPPADESFEISVFVPHSTPGGDFTYDFSEEMVRQGVDLVWRGVNSVSQIHAFTWDCSSTVEETGAYLWRNTHLDVKVGGNPYDFWATHTCWLMGLWNCIWSLLLRDIPSSKLPHNCCRPRKFEMAWHEILWFS